MKNSMNKYQKKKKKTFPNKIRQMRQKSPREYWKYINSGTGKKLEPSVEINVFYEFFKDLNETDPASSEIPESGFPEFVEDNNMNDEITTGEIARSIRDLKNNKASDLDKILVLPIFHKLLI